MMLNTTAIVWINGQEQEVEVSFEAYISSTGIGSYEYCGCKGFDKGQDYVEHVELMEVNGDSPYNLPWIVLKQVEKQLNNMSSKEVMSLVYEELEDRKEAMALSREEY